ncbi:MAG: metallophosphoesterase [Planctomycetota bacterium]
MGIHIVLAIVGIVAGEVFLVLDFINRVLGSYSRTAAGTLWRLAAGLVPFVALASPAVLLALGWDTTAVHVLCVVAGAVGWLVALHFLVPYKWGVRRMPEDTHQRGQRPLRRGVMLQDCRLETDRLPEGTDHLTIVALSDLHCTTHQKVETLTEALEALGEEERFDFVLVLGDFGEEPNLLPEVLRGLATIPSRYGVYCVRGNHDFERDRAELIRDLAAVHGVLLLPNETHDVPGTGITLVGIERPWDSQPLPKPTGGRFAIGLSHTPDNIRRFERLGVDIGFAGHTHGGRLSLGRLGSVLVPGLLGRFMERGLFQVGKTRMYVTAGVGYFLARFGKEGEILRVTLCRPKPAGEED